MLSDAQRIKAGQEVITRQLEEIKKLKKALMTIYGLTSRWNADNDEITDIAFDALKDEVDVE